MRDNIADQGILKTVFSDLYINEYYAICIAFLRYKEVRMPKKELVIVKNLNNLEKDIKQ